MGDFYYTEIEYDSTGRTAVRFHICEPFDCQPGVFFWAERDQVINLIEDGFTLEPIPKTGPLEKERRIIRLVKQDGQVFLRNDDALLPADRLNGHS